MTKPLPPPSKPPPYDPSFHVETYGHLLQFLRLDATPFLILSDLVVGAQPHGSGHCVLTIMGSSQPTIVLQPYAVVRAALSKRS